MEEVRRQLGGKPIPGDVAPWRRFLLKYPTMGRACRLFALLLAGLCLLGPAKSDAASVGAEVFGPKPPVPYVGGFSFLDGRPLGPVPIPELDVSRFPLEGVSVFRPANNDDVCAPFPYILNLIARDWPGAIKGRHSPGGHIPRMLHGGRLFKFKSPDLTNLVNKGPLELISGGWTMIEYFNHGFHLAAPNYNCGLVHSRIGAQFSPARFLAGFELPFSRDPESLGSNPEADGRASENDGEERDNSGAILFYELALTDEPDIRSMGERYIWLRLILIGMVGLCVVGLITFIVRG